MQRADRKRKARLEDENSKLRAKTWGLKRLRSWWGKLLRRAEERGDEKTLAALEVRKQMELTEGKRKLSLKLESRGILRRKRLDGDEFRRYQRYLKKCEWLIRRLEKRAKLFKVLPRTARYFKLNHKHAHHKAEADRCKKILFGAIMSPLPCA